MYSNKLSESKIVKRKIILNLEKILHEKCFQDFGHNTRVKNMTLNFAKLIDGEITSNEINNLSLFASLHDIGKVSIPKKVLSKNGPLSPSEWEIMKNYTKIGFRMAQSIDEPLLAQSILHLREHWDGNGYPYGLKREEIPLHSRIVSIVDAYDVMTHDKTYKKALSEEEAIEELKKYSGKCFHPHLISIFLDNYKNL